MFSQAALNAVLNGSSALFLAVGYGFIRRRMVFAHKVCMVSAFTVSTAFLISYLIYHARVGSVHFQGQGSIRTFYFGLLISHTLLAALILPLAILTLQRAWKGQFERHRAIARWTLPIWFYVSVSGVVVYFLLYHLYAPRFQ
jgi:putative membrane protein